MKPTTLTLVRHGETEENVAHILQGHMPGRLTPLGRQQAVQTAETLLQEEHFDIVLCSPLQRCLDTAQLMLGRMTAAGVQAPPMLLVPMLRERDWGSATGMVVDGVHRITIPPDAETVAQLKSRAQVFLDHVSVNYPGKRVLAVSHGLFCRFLQAVHRGVDISEVERMQNGEWRVLTLSSEK